MIDTDDIVYLTTEKYTELTKEIIATVRDLCNDLEILTAKFSQDRYLSSEEVAERLRCTIQQIPRDIPCNHIGRNYIYKLSDVEKFLSDRKAFRR